MNTRACIGLGLAALGLTFGMAIASACSSNNTDTLGSSGGGTSSGGCGSYGTTASDGQQYVQQEGCTSCHGANLAGSNTALVSGQEPGLTIIGSDLLYPPNLTPDPTTGLGSWTALEIYTAITSGLDNESERLCPEMGQHYPNMCANEANAIVAYLQSLAPVVNQVPRSCCPPLKGTYPCGGDGG